VSTLALTLAPPRPRTGAWVAFQVGCAVAGSVLIAGLAQVQIHLSFTPVPITGQTLGVLLVGAAYGPALGAATVGLYLLEGVLGMPVFAAQSDGSHLTGPDVLAFASATGGYLVGFVVASALVGSLARRGWDRSFRSAIGAMLLGELALYAVGLPWLHHALPGLTGQPATWELTLEQGLYPFIVGDTIKLLLAAGLLPGAWKLLRRARPEGV
jgi:biotin transport system substrate-specific component